jgi:hypothetical protein
MLSRGVNYWVSWADLTFMLFIAGLATVAVSEEHRAKVERELVTTRGQLEVLRRHSHPCADADAFLGNFSSCVAKATGRNDPPRSGCFVTVGEDVIRFANGEARALDSSAAAAVAQCLYTNALRFSSTDLRSFDAITIHIDGHTDCVGTAGDNELLGAERALSVYSRLLASAEVDPSWRSAEERRAFLSRFAVRSFGATRPVDGSRCQRPSGWPNDRRVVVSVQLATESVAEPAKSAVPRRRG